MLKALSTVMAEAMDGQCLRVVSFKPTLGAWDAEAGVVHALVVADAHADLERADKIITKGIYTAFNEREPGARLGALNPSNQIKKGIV